MRKLFLALPLRALALLLLLPALLLLARSGRAQTVSSFATVPNPGGITHDAAGNLYVTTYAAGGIKKITPAGVISTFVADGTYVNPSALIFDGAGNLYVSASSVSGSVYRITPAGVSMLLASNLDFFVRGLAFDAAGDLYAVCQSTPRIVKITPGGTVTTFLANTAGLMNQPYGLVRDGSGNFYVSNIGNNNVLKVTAAGAVSVFATGVSQAYGLCFDGSGNLAVVSNGGNALYKITPAGVVSTFASGYSVRQLEITQNVDDNLYATSYFDNAVYKITQDLTAVTAVPTSIGVQSADVGGTVTNTTGSPTTDTGIVFDPANTLPTLGAAGSVSGGAVTGAFSTTLFGLIPNHIYYVRAYTRTASTTVYGAVETFTTLADNVTWNGSVNTDWATAANWTPAQVPGAEVTATIAAGSPHQPLVTGARSCASLDMLAGGNLTLSANAVLTASGDVTLVAGSTYTQASASELYLSGDLVNNGATYTLAPTSEVGFGIGGFVHKVRGAVGFTFETLTVGEQSTGSPNDVLQLFTDVRVRRKLDLSHAARVQALGNGTLTLLSTPAQTALVVQDATSQIDGTLTVQRAVTGPYFGMGYRHYASPVGGASVSGLATAGFAPMVNVSYNASATPELTVPYPTVFSYDERRIASTTSSLTGFDQGWQSPLSLADDLATGEGYTVHLSGTAVVAFTGSANNGDYNKNNLTRSAGTGTGLHLLGNPYPAPLNYSLVTPANRPNMDAAMYVFEPTGPYAGTYRAYVNGTGGSPILAVGQGFFTRVSAGQASGSFQFRNSQRLTDPAAATTFGRGTADARPRLRLTVAAATGPADELTLYTQANATFNADREFDAIKILNPCGLNLAALAASGETLAIDALPSLTAPTVVPLTLAVPTAGTYTLTVAELANFGDARVYLRDAATGTEQLLAAGTATPVSLPATALSTTRFALVLRPTGVLGTAANALAAQATVYPNPARASFVLQVPPVAGATAATATLLNNLGQVVSTRTLALPLGGATATYSTDGLASGVYALRLSAGGLAATLCVVVE